MYTTFQGNPTLYLQKVINLSHEKVSPRGRHIVLEVVSGKVVLGTVSEKDNSLETFKN